LALFSPETTVLNMARHIYAPRLISQPDEYAPPEEVEFPETSHCPEMFLVEVATQIPDYNENVSFKMPDSHYQCIGYVDSFNKEIKDEVNNIFNQKFEQKITPELGFRSKISN